MTTVNRFQPNERHGGGAIGAGGPVEHAAADPFRRAEVPMARWLSPPKHRIACAEVAPQV
jgi:hypothetical protein